MSKQFLEAGKIVATHGLRGDVKIQPWANSPEFLRDFKTLYIDSMPMTVIASKVHKNCVLMTFEGVSDYDAASLLKNKIVCINKSDAKLSEGEHFLTDLLGFTAIDQESGKELGTITDILPLHPNEVYVITGQREILIPAVPEFVKQIDSSTRRITFKLIEGM